MSQPSAWGVPQAGPASPYVMASQMQGSLDALLSAHLGTSRPSYAVAGMEWAKSVSSTQVNIYRYDGGSDILLGTYNPTTHVWTPVIADTSITAAKLASDVTGLIEGGLDRLALSSVLPSLDLRPVAGWTPPLVTFTRASAAARTNEKGFFESVASGALRYDYNSEDGAALGWRLEAAATNQLLYSEQFDNAYWTKVGSTVTANSIRSPGGSSTADTLIENTSTGVHRVSRQVAFVSGTAYTLTFYVRAAGRSRCRLQLNAEAFSDAVARVGFFDLGDGTCSVVTGSGATVSMTRQYSRWWRVSITATATASTTTWIGLYLVDGAGSASYTGDGASGLYLWGAQFEGNVVPTAPITTTDSAVTRAADWLSVATSAFPFNLETGTLFIEARLDRPVGGGTQVLASFWDGTTNNRVMIRCLNSGYLDCLISSAGTVWLSKQATCPSGFFRAALSWGSVSDAAVNGALIGAAEAGATPVALTQLNIGSWSGWPMFGHVRRVSVFPRRLSRSELQLITGGLS